MQQSLTGGVEDPDILLTSTINIAIAEGIPQSLGMTPYMDGCELERGGAAVVVMEGLQGLFLSNTVKNR